KTPALQSAGGKVKLDLQSGSDRLDFAHFGDHRPDPPLDATLHRQRGDRTRATRPGQTELKDTILIQADEFHVAAVDLQCRADRVERALDPISKAGWRFGRGKRVDHGVKSSLDRPRRSSLRIPEARSLQGLGPFARVPE